MGLRWIEKGYRTKIGSKVKIFEMFWNYVILSIYILVLDPSLRTLKKRAKGLFYRNFKTIEQPPRLDPESSVKYALPEYQKFLGYFWFQN